MSENKDYVRASEIGEYVYCKRAWWLNLIGRKTGNPQALIDGKISHNKLSRLSGTFQRVKYVALALIILSVMGLLILFIYYQLQWFGL